jgi:hypothetical protein
MAAGRSEADTLMLERALFHLALAAEELGPDAAVEAIHARAKELEARRT